MIYKSNRLEIWQDGRSHQDKYSGIIISEYTETAIHSSLDRLLANGKLGSRKYNGRTVYRVLEEDLESSVSANSTETMNNDEFIDFKCFMEESIKEIHKELVMLKERNKDPPLPPQNTVDLKYIIESKDVIIGFLQEEIKHLRYENNILIESLKHNQSDISHTNNKPISKSNHTANVKANDYIEHKILKTIDQWQKPKHAFRIKTPIKKNVTIPLSNRFGELNVPETINQNNTPLEQLNTSGSSNKKKAIIFADSMTKRVKVNKFNKFTPNYSSFFQSFPGVNSFKLKHHVEPILKEEKRDLAIIHCGTNDLCPRTPTRALSDVEIVKEIEEIGINCKNADVKKIIISGIITRNDIDIEPKRIRVNNLLKSMCDKNGFQYVSNDNINESQLWKDGLHLSHRGLCTLADNFIDIINSQAG